MVLDSVTFSEQLYKLMEQCLFGLLMLVCDFACRKNQAVDTILDTFYLQDADMIDFLDVVEVRATTSLRVDARDVEDPDAVTGWNATLIKAKAEASFCLVAFQYSTPGGDSLGDVLVGFAFDGTDSVIVEGLIVGEVETGV